MSEPFEVVRHPTARRIRLSLDPASGRARLVVPKRAALKPALAWAQGKTEWIAQQRARLPQPRPFVPGMAMTVADQVLTIGWQPGSRRRVEVDGDILSLSGPLDTLPRRVETWLKRQALDLLTRETADYAAKAGVTVARVAIGDARGRWGSCAHDGAIRYSWRLILAPGWVRRATVAHEVAHRVHMNHAPVFHALVARLYGEDPTPARAWLRDHGAALHWVGRSS
ncbi:SprT family zinc-dependent metalloprotease [Sphingomonas sp. 2SG]|uniref:M48 family metallopeptidase n=1 Tax=Sphingomonas sp. 2SG TaxID=2502201 RepID=UPI0010F50609|nr:SprT family zinc-dependent metalloprotease [Sphingomonas sp. 2SG]